MQTDTHLTREIAQRDILFGDQYTNMAWSMCASVHLTTCVRHHLEDVCGICQYTLSLIISHSVTVVLCMFSPFNILSIALEHISQFVSINFAGHPTNSIRLTVLMCQN